MVKSLEEKLSAAISPAHMLQNSPTGRYVFPIPAEHTNYIDETQAWRKTAVLFDQSYHMTDLYISGPDTVRLLSDLAVNSFKNFGPNKAKQFIACNHDGYIIGDGILFGLDVDKALLIGRPCAPNWVQFHAETGDYDVVVERDEARGHDPNDLRKTYRFEVQGPNAMAILNELNEGGPLSTKFFSMGEIVIAGCKARTLAHGMGGAHGLEFWGPIADKAKVEAVVLEAGARHGLVRAGYRAYSVTAIESGWFAAPLPAIYTGDKMKPYREWLSEYSFEGISSVGGSFMPEDVSGYYLTPWDLDYGRMVKFDHEFIGRAALEKIAEAPQRTKATLIWDKESVLEILGGMMEEGDMPKILEIPSGEYSLHPYDRVEKNGKLAGIAGYPMYSANERAWMSLAVIDKALAAPGTRVELVWGEPNGGTAKPMVERHRQIRLGATVEAWPISEVARTEYRKRA